MSARHTARSASNSFPRNDLSRPAVAKAAAGFLARISPGSSHAWKRVSARVEPKRIAKRFPASLVRRTDQPAGNLARNIARPIELRRISARFPVDQPAWQMIPGHQPVEHQEVEMPDGQRAVLMRGAPEIPGLGQLREVAAVLRARRLPAEAPGNARPSSRPAQLVPKRADHAARRHRPAPQAPSPRSAMDALVALTGS